MRITCIQINGRMSIYANCNALDELLSYILKRVAEKCPNRVSVPSFEADESWETLGEG